MNPGEDPRRAALLSALDEADRTLRRLRLDDPRRGEVVKRIRSIDDALDGLGDTA